MELREKSRAGKLNTFTLHSDAPGFVTSVSAPRSWPMTSGFGVAAGCFWAYVYKTWCNS